MDAASGGGIDAAITIFACEGDDYCGLMANGQAVHQGAAACGYALALGARFVVAGDPTGRVYQCEDRGYGPYWWVDIWLPTAAEGYAWLAQVGSQGRIVLR